ncbi:MAG TPA: histidine kinase [Candidatus Acidoferrales bacterium]
MNASLVKAMKPPSHILFSSDLWQPALAKYAATTHVTVELFDPDLRLVFGPIHSTPLFELFQRGGYDPGLFAECARQCLIQKTDRPAVTVSKIHGLAVVGTSLVLDDKIVGAAVAGYALVDFSQLSEIQRVAKDARLDFDRVWRVAREQSPIPQQRLTIQGELLQVLGDALLRESSRTRQYEDAAEELEDAGRAKDDANKELRQTASVLRESEERYRTLFDLGPVAVYSCDASGVIREFNRRAAELWGREPKPGDTDERWCGSFKMLRPDGVWMPHEQCPMAEVISGKVPAVHDAEVQIERPDGSRITVLVNIRPLKDEQEQITGAINCFVDITGRKMDEKALQEAHDHLESMVEERTASVRQLSLKLLTVQDEEHRSIARELHDSVGQHLAGIKMTVDRLQQMESPKQRTETLSKLSESLDQCMTETRTISYLLHPPLIDELGFRAAARWFVEGFSERSGIKVNLEFSNESQRLPRSIELPLFRILQASLSNVHRHAHSPSVDVRFIIDATEATLEVKDYGKGIEPDVLTRLNHNGTGTGIGLAGMRERLRELGGRLQVESGANGTLIRAMIPVSMPTDAKKSPRAA